VAEKRKKDRLPIGRKRVQKGSRKTRGEVWIGPEHTLSEPKPTKLDAYKQIVDEWPNQGQTKGKVERTVQYVRDNFMIGIKYNGLADLNGQALAWCNKFNSRVHATTNEIPFERLRKEGLSLLSREYIIDKINLRRVHKDCLISYAGN